MKYFSIDTETTGLNHKKCQIIQFSAIYRDTDLNIPIDEIPEHHKFTVYVRHDNIIGELYAINMNANIFHEISQGKNTKYPIINASYLWSSFEKFARKCLDLSPPSRSIEINVAGKNFSEFDKKFIKKYRHTDSILSFHRRVLDPGSMWSTPSDTQLPNLQECLIRAGYSHTVSHDAQDDALDVIKCVEKNWERNV